MEKRPIFESAAVINLFNHCNLNAPLALKPRTGTSHLTAMLLRDGSVKMNGKLYANIDIAMGAAPKSCQSSNDAWQFWCWYNQEHQIWSPLAQLRIPQGESIARAHPSAAPMKRHHALEYPNGPGKIGVMACPGRGNPSISTSQPSSLQRDILSLELAGYATVVSLVEAHEFTMLGVPDFVQTIQNSNLIWLHLPVRDTHTPDEQFEQKWRQVGPLLHRQLIAGSSVAFHCHNGLGRSCMVAARLLIEAGVQPPAAVADILQCEPNGIENPCQESYLMAQTWNPIAKLARGA